MKAGGHGVRLFTAGTNLLYRHNQPPNNTNERNSNMNDLRRYTVWGECIEELEDAADMVDSYMEEQGQGRNVIYYQIIGAEHIAYIDIGFITDRAVRDLAQRFLLAERGALA